MMNMNTKELEDELDELLPKLLEGKLEDDLAIKKSKAIIKDIASPSGWDIDLHEPISNDQINILWKEYSKRMSGQTALSIADSKIVTHSAIVMFLVTLIAIYEVPNSIELIERILRHDMDIVKTVFGATILMTILDMLKRYQNGKNETKIIIEFRK